MVDVEGSSQRGTSIRLDPIGNRALLEVRLNGLHNYDVCATADAAIVALRLLAPWNPVRLARIREEDLTGKEFAAGQQQQDQCGNSKDCGASGHAFILKDATISHKPSRRWRCCFRLSTGLVVPDVTMSVINHRGGAYGITAGAPREVQKKWHNTGTRVDRANQPAYRNSVRIAEVVVAYFCRLSRKSASVIRFTACSSVLRLASLRGSDASSRWTNSWTIVNSMSASISGSDNS